MTPPLMRGGNSPHRLSRPQATTAAWAGGRMVAWDYEVHSQDYDPQKDTWSTPQRMPLEFSECYPDSVAFDGLVFAFFCGRAAIYDPSTSAWQEIRGGPLEEEVWSDAYRDRIKVWRFASLASAGDRYLSPDGWTHFGRQGHRLLRLRGLASFLLGIPGS
jgi:hypothetical protein